MIDLQHLYRERELPKKFWIGGTIVFPFFALYVTRDNYSPNLLWYLGALLCAISATSFYALHVRVGTQSRFAPARARIDTAPMAMEAEHG